MKMATLLVIGIILFLLWPNIKRWLAGYMARKTEDFIRQATGMPPREKGRRGSSASSGHSSYNGAGTRARNNIKEDGGPIIPKEYAEDVEFVETVEYSETIIGEEHNGESKNVKSESQVSDAEYIEVKE